MGKGDVKTKKGKIKKGTFGVRRRRKKTKAYVASPKPAAKKAKSTKTTKAKKTTKSADKE